MSRAFTKEDGDPDDDGLPERPVPLGPNPVTESGLAALKARVEALRAELKRVTAGEPGGEKRALERELRYFDVRLKTAALTLPGEPGVVRFGSTVELSEPGGGTRRVRIVGHDEADPEKGLLSWTSPLADALLGKAAGAEVPLGPSRLRVLSVSAG
ncbi:MAG: transcription elongation factor [Elusimicrobia bacterium]|nr:MAG: transcription elongation factor [Elusimicrobiota bacterium]